MERLKFEDLNPFQLSKIVNGCGSPKLHINAPSFIFKSDCGEHDFGYWRGFGPGIFNKLFWKYPIKYFLLKKIDRYEQDQIFFSNMLDTNEGLYIQKKNELKKIYNEKKLFINHSELIKIKEKYERNIKIAIIYYTIVRIFGFLLYNWWRNERDLTWFNRYKIKEFK